MGVWSYHGDFYSSEHKVILDQNLSIYDIGEILSSQGVAVARLPPTRVPDRVIMKDAAKYGALVVTRDHHFTAHPNSLLIDGKVNRCKDVLFVVDTVLYVLDLTDRSPTPNGCVQDHSAYYTRLEKLREQFKTPR